MGRLVVIGIFIVTGLMGSAIYWTFTHHDYFSSAVNSRLQSRFAEYLQKAQALPPFTLAQTVFDVQEKVLIVIVPNLEQSSVAIDPEVARGQLSDFITTWLKTEIKKTADLQVQVKFQSEITPHSSSSAL